jgi:hypothetical protein
MKEFSINMPGGAKQLFNAFEAEAKRLAAEEAKLLGEFAAPEESTSQSYPVEVWDGTLYGEFADRCTQDNNIAPELFIESLKTIVGSIVGDRLYGDHKGVNARQYTVLVAPPQSGKDVAVDAARDICIAAEFDSDGGASQGFLTNGVPDFKHIGARICNCASENAVITHAAKWKNLLNRPTEFGSLLDKSGIAGAGQALLELMLGAWDSTMPVLSTAKNREDVPAKVLFSLLTSIQPDRLSGMQVSSGLYSRIIWVTTPPLDVDASLMEPDFGDFQKRLFAKLLPLEKFSLKITTSYDARVVLRLWFDSIKERTFEDDQVRTRINTITHRNALHLAWLLNSPEVTAEIMCKAIHISNWQLGVRAELFLKETNNPVACFQQKILKALRKKPALTRRQIYRATHAYEVGTVIFEQALNGLVKAREVKELPNARRNSTIFGIPPKGEQDNG